MIRKIEILFGEHVRSSPNTDLIVFMIDTIGANVIRYDSMPSDPRMIRAIEVTFQSPTELTDYDQHALVTLVSRVTDEYRAQNPTRVMWAAGVGSKPIWSKADAQMLGYKVEPDAPDSGEPAFDDEVFQIQCEEREDYYGENELNPHRSGLRAASEMRRELHRRNSRQAKRVKRQRVDRVVTQLVIAASYGSTNPENLAATLKDLELAIDMLER